jgi:hypothetical protein
MENEIAWVIVGTYKTRPEENGWYISDNAFKPLLWDRMPFETNQKTEYLPDLEIGRLIDCPNVMFFDLAKFDITLQSTLDDEVLKKKYEDLILGTFRLKSIIQYLERNYHQVRIGFVGKNAYSFFHHAKNETLPTQIPRDWRNLKIKQGYGEVVMDGNNSNVKYYLLENITSRFYKTRISNLEGWQLFWKS